VSGKKRQKVGGVREGGHVWRDFWCEGWRVLHTKGKDKLKDFFGGTTSKGVAKKKEETESRGHRLQYRGKGG